MMEYELCAAHFLPEHYFPYIIVESAYLQQWLFPNILRKCPIVSLHLTLVCKEAVGR